MVVVVVTVASFQVESHCISIVREFASEGLLTVLTPVIQPRLSSLWRAPCLAALRIQPAGDVLARAASTRRGRAACAPLPPLFTPASGSGSQSCPGVAVAPIFRWRNTMFDGGLGFV